MIKLDFEYTILFTSTVAGVGTAADSTPTAILWRNGSASGVSVTVSTTAQTGLYKAVFTTDAGWAADDLLELYATATIAGTAGYLAKVWSSTEIGAVELDSTTQTQLDTIEETGEQLLSAAAVPSPTVARSTADTNPITFVWPVEGATITAEVSKNNGTYAAAAGVAAFLRTESSKHYYTLAYNSADRPAAEGTARYKFTDGTYTRYVNLRIEGAAVDTAAVAKAVLLHDWTTIVDVVPGRSVLNALRHIRNKWQIVGTTKTVMKEDDTTAAFTTTITADGSGNITADAPN